MTMTSEYRRQLEEQLAATEKLCDEEAAAAEDIANDPDGKHLDAWLLLCCQVGALETQLAALGD